MKIKKILGVGLLGASLLYGCNSPVDNSQPENVKFEQVITNEFNVLDKKDILIPQLEALIKFNSEGCLASRDFSYADLQEEAKKIVEPLWGTSTPVISEHNVLEEVTDYHLHNTIISGHNVMGENKDAIVSDSVLYGHNVLDYSVRPLIRDSFILGHNTLSGFHFSSNMNNEKFQKFLELEDDLLSGDAVKVLEALDEYKKLIPEDRLDSIKEWMNKTRDDIGREYEYAAHEMIREYKDSIKDKNQGMWMWQGKNLAATAHDVDMFINQMNFVGDTYHVDVDNSVIFGWGALDDVKGGVIKNSIIAGYGPLSNANVKLENCYIISNSGTKYVESEILGNPKDFDKIPKIVEYNDFEHDVTSVLDPWK